MHLHGNMHVQMAVNALSFLSWGTTFTALSGQAWAPEPAAEPRSGTSGATVGRRPGTHRPEAGGEQHRYQTRPGGTLLTSPVWCYRVRHVEGRDEPAGGPTEMEAKRGLHGDRAVFWDRRSGRHLPRRDDPIGSLTGGLCERLAASHPRRNDPWP